MNKKWFKYEYKNNIIEEFDSILNIENFNNAFIYKYDENMEIGNRLSKTIVLEKIVSI